MKYSMSLEERKNIQNICQKIRMYVKTLFINLQRILQNVLMMSAQCNVKYTTKNFVKHKFSSRHTHLCTCKSFVNILIKIIYIYKQKTNFLVCLIILFY